MSASKYSPTTWAQELLIDLKCPSGQMCQVKRVSVDGLVASGLLDDMDLLTKYMQAEVMAPAKGLKTPRDHKSKKPTKAQQAASDEQQFMELLSNPTEFGKLMRMVDRVVEHVVQQPTVFRPIEFVDEQERIIPDSARKAYADRDDPFVYTDEISIEDRMHIFGFSMGQRAGDLKSGSNESRADMGNLEDESDVPGTTK
jgi:hypothetical protein